MNRSNILDEAKRCVTKDRAATHGKPEDTFSMIAGLWSLRLGVTITPAQACIMMMDLKTARAWNNPNHGDNWVDMAGYAACGGELAAPAEVKEEKQFPTASKAQPAGSAGELLAQAVKRSGPAYPVEAGVVERALHRKNLGPYVPDPDLVEVADGV